MGLRNITAQSLINNIPAWLCIYIILPENSKIEFIEWNKHMIDITGYTLDDINEIGFLNILNDTYSFKNFTNSSFSSNEKEYEISCKNGKNKKVAKATLWGPSTSFWPSAFFEHLRGNSDRAYILFFNALISLKILVKS